MLFLFPSDYFKPMMVDDIYAEQASSLRAAGFDTATISLESLESSKPRINPSLQHGITVVYRGWMLSRSKYESLVKVIENEGAIPFTSSADYLAAHHLPNWYPLIKDLTPETKCFSVNDDLEAEMTKLGWGKFFVKDYVKSLKTSVGSTIESASEITTVVSEMAKFRGTIEGGVCVRRVEDFIPEMERRYFVIKGVAWSASSDLEIPDIVQECAKRITSKFFSVDVIERRDGVKRVVEIGDGQVSDLVGWSPTQFTEIWQQSEF